MFQLTQALRRAVQQQSQRTATVFDGRERTWAEVADRVPRQAAALRDLGVSGDGERVAILGLNSDDYVELLLASAWAGGVSVPLNTRWSLSEIAYAISDCEPTVLVVDEHFADSIEELARLSGVTFRVVGMTHARSEGLAHLEELIADAEPVEDSPRAGDDLCGIYYTGGTTGRPKGVMLSHTNLIMVSMMWIASLGFADRTRYLHSAGLFHLAGAAPAVALTLAGGTHVVIPKFEPVSVFQTIERERVNFCLFVPTMINMMLNHPEFGKYDLSSVEYVEYGASPMPEAVLRRALVELPTWKFFQGYGCSEATALVTYLPPEYHDLDSPLSEKLASAGRAAAGVEVQIGDTQGNELPRGEVGEIQIRGPIVMKGYWNRPEETEAALKNGWLRTGDGAYMDQEGFVFIVDRLKDMIVSGGENVYSGEVEQAIYQHEAVRECAVVGVPHENWGEAVHAIVVPKDGHTLTEQEVIDHCRSLIGRYKCPVTVDVRTEPLPISGAGKILKHVLREPYWEAQPRRVN